MKLTENQREHYKRQIIIPEIGEEGQEKLLDSTVFLYCEDIESLRPLAYYIAALGIGRIICYLEDKSGADSLFDEVVDLNNDTSIDYLSEDNNIADCRIILGGTDFVAGTGDKQVNEKFIPTIISINSQWKGTLHTFDKEDSFTNFINKLNNKNKENNINSRSAFLANALSSTLCAIEAVKLCLNIGHLKKEILYYDLFNLVFEQTENKIDIFDKLTDTNIDIKQKLSEAKVLIVGAGGLGSPVAYGMALANVGTLGLLDLDLVEASNLNRQVLHSFSRIGMPKAKSAELLLKKLRPDIIIKTYIRELTKDNAEEIFSEYDMVIAAVDNIPTRYIINDTCIALNKPFSEAGVLRLHGTATTIIPHKGHCYRCLYPNYDGGNLPGVNGVLGPIPGTMGFIQAAEALKVLTGLGTSLKNKILLFDSLDMDFNIVDIDKNPECPICKTK